MCATSMFLIAARDEVGDARSELNANHPLIMPSHKKEQAIRTLHATHTQISPTLPADAAKKEAR